MEAKHRLTPSDIMPMAEYAAIRKEKRREIIEQKRNRRLAVGPYATFHFESYQSMWLQVHEMLYIEKGGAEQVAGELDAYNPLIPKGEELVATIFFEIDDPERRRTVLAELGGVEETVFMRLDEETVNAAPEKDQDRTSEEGKASSVQFVHFAFTQAQIRRFKTPGEHVLLGFEHPQYGHMTVLPEPIRAALAADFD
ncbi:MAG: DUF3501 family protein [Proteobacteria bacterium]|nr:DUF3501 family protein [Pseudomonadota bacterium]MBI3499019.1 DUF3501 family protein [Pseudomonadota bacterium]